MSQDMAIGRRRGKSDYPMASMSGVHGRAAPCPGGRGRGAAADIRSAQIYITLRCRIGPW
jgi:hypothetical protein